MRPIRPSRQLPEPRPLALRCRCERAEANHRTAPLAGAAAAAVWAAQQPLDKRVFGSSYDDVELLGKLVTRDSGWPAAGLAHPHGQRRRVRRRLRARAPVPPGPARSPASARPWPSTSPLWPLTRSSTATTPHAGPRAAAGNRRAFAQAAWRHAPFGLVLGELERRLNPEGRVRAPRAGAGLVERPRQHRARGRRRDERRAH